MPKLIEKLARMPQDRLDEAITTLAEQDVASSRIEGIELDMRQITALYADRVAQYRKDKGMSSTEHQKP